MNEYIILIGIISFGVGFAIAFWIKGKMLSQKIRDSEAEASRILEDSKRRAETLLKEANLEVKDRLFKMKSEFDAETKETRSEIIRRERRLSQKEEHIERKIEQFDQREREIIRQEKFLAKREDQINGREKRYNELIEEQKMQLEKISGLTAEQAKELLIRAMENEARYEAAKVIKRIENDAKEQADRKAKKIIATAIQRYAGDYVAERTVSVVQLPNDEMKGRIIGREGRNIRALESATGIDLIIDDTPEAVILSGFNPVRREVARISLMRLISDGRIHPARIEDIVKKVGQEVDLAVKEAGEQAAFDLEVHGIHHELIKYLGRLKFRTSYAQNVLQHSSEVGFLCGIMAAELGLNQKLARRMGLLHDIGKAIDHEVEGPHAFADDEDAHAHVHQQRRGEDEHEDEDEAKARVERMELLKPEGEFPAHGCGCPRDGMPWPSTPLDPVQWRRRKGGPTAGCGGRAALSPRGRALPPGPDRAPRRNRLRKGAPPGPDRGCQGPDRSSSTAPGPAASHWTGCGNRW